MPFIKNRFTTKVCRNCGHVQGDRMRDSSIGCCPEQMYVPLREFIIAWRKDFIELSNSKRYEIRRLERILSEVPQNEH